MPDVFDKEQVPSFKRADSYMLDPREIVIKPEYNGRHILPPIDDLLEEFPKIGQHTPVLITKEDGFPVLLAGHRRWRAAIELTKQKAGVHEGGVFKLKCSYFKGTPVECFVLTVSENASREAAQPIDDGYNICKLRNFGLEDEDIALRIYRKFTTDKKPDVKWIQERAALVDLAEEAMEALNSGRLKPNAAAVLATLSKQAQRDKINAVPEGKKITAASIKEPKEPRETKPRVVSTVDLVERDGEETLSCEDIIQFFAGVAENNKGTLIGGAANLNESLMRGEMTSTTWIRETGRLFDTYKG